MIDTLTATSSPFYLTKKQIAGVQVGDVIELSMTSYTITAITETEITIKPVPMQKVWKLIYSITGEYYP